MQFNKVDPGLNLYIDISTACNARCGFCIAPSIDRKNGDGFFDGLEYALNLTEKHKGSVQVVGGEPMISTRLPNVLAEIGRRKFHRIVLNTNGTMITPEKVDLMEECGVHYCNISRHHWNSDKNQEIMKMNPVLSNRDLIASIDLIKSRNIDVRLNCNLIKGYVQDEQTISAYIEWSKSIGVDTISFSQTFPLGLFDYQQPIIPGYAEEVQVDLIEVVKDIDKKYNTLSSAASYILTGHKISAWGGSGWSKGLVSGDPSAKRRYWVTSGSTVFSIKTLAGYDYATGLPHATRYNKQNDSELQDMLCFLVVHPDGTTTASWDKRERVLFSPQKRRVKICA